MDPLLSGTCAERPFPKVVYALTARGFTGSLTLEQDGKTWALWWQDGQVIDADSDTPEDAVGRVLRAENLIDNAQYGELLRRMAQAPDRKPFDLLLEMKALDAARRPAAVRTALMKRAQRVFSLPLATYRAESGAHQRGEDAALDPRWLIYRGLRAHYDAERLGRELAPLEPYAVKLLPGNDATLAVFGFGDEEMYVLAYLSKGYWCLPDLVDACVSLPQPTVHSLVYSLLACELLDVKPATAVPRLRKRAREQTLAVSAAKSPFAGATAAAAAAPPTVRPQQPSIPPPTAPATPPAIVTPSDGPAADVEKQVLDKLKAVQAGANHFAILELPPTCSSADVKIAYFKMAKVFHPDRIASLKLEKHRAGIERIFARMSEAFSTLSDDAKRADYKKIQAAGGEEAVRRKEQEEEAKALKILKAEEHFQLGEMAVKRNQFGLALTEFQKALDDNPEESEHHALFAWATWMSASDKNAVLSAVKQIFARALELNENCVPAYYYLGHVYVFQGDIPRAMAQFQRALELRPGYIDAERELRLLQSRVQKGVGKGSSSLNPFRKK